MMGFWHNKPHNLPVRRASGAGQRRQALTLGPPACRLCDIRIKNCQLGRDVLLCRKAVDDKEVSLLGAPRSGRRGLARGSADVGTPLCVQFL